MDKTDRAQSTEESVARAEEKARKEKLKEKVALAKAKQEEDKAKKKFAQEQYEDIRRRVAALADMTGTPGWAITYRWLKDMQANHAKQCLIAKPNEVVAHQAGNKTVDDIIAKFEKAVDELNSFCESNSLFAKFFPYRATWNGSMGTIEMHKV